MDEVDADAIAAYRMAVVRGRRPDELCDHLGIAPEKLRKIITLLQELDLVRVAPGPDGSIVAVSPDIALAGTVRPLKRAIAEADELVARATTRIDLFRSVYYDACRERDRDEAIDLLWTVEEVLTSLAEQALACREEVLSARPNTHTDGTTTELARNVDLLRRGVHLRVLYPHSVRFNGPTQAYLKRLILAGAGVRTMDEVTEQIIIFDRRVVYLADRREVGAPSAVRIREPTVVSYLYRRVDSQWDNGMDLDMAAAPDVDIEEQVKRSIIRLLAQGLKDEVVSRRLGMSVRSCRKHISEIMTRLGATSRFQAGVLAEQARLLDRLVAAEMSRPGRSR
jgi:DNA-binding CsgD family transcriptional regulator